MLSSEGGEAANGFEGFGRGESGKLLNFDEGVSGRVRLEKVLRCRRGARACIRSDCREGE